MKKPPPTKRPTVVKKPKAVETEVQELVDKIEVPAFTTETEFMVAEEMRFVPAQLFFYRQVVMLAHVRDMFTSLPDTHTIGKIRRFLPDEPNKDREGPMVGKLRQMIEERA